MNQTTYHRKKCAAWKARDTVGLRRQRLRDAKAASGNFNPANLCPECGFTSHQEGCSHRRKDRHAEMLGGKDTLSIVLAGVAIRGLSAEDSQEPTPRRVVKTRRRKGFKSYLITLECGHKITRKEVPSQVFCHQCVRTIPRVGGFFGKV